MNQQQSTQDQDSLVGSYIGNYQIISRLGVGAMGEVYLGEHPEIGRKVAIKVLIATLSADRKMADRFVSEARAVNKINHPNIIQIFDFDKLPDGRLFYTMEYLEGRELTEIIKKEAPLSLARTNHILSQIAGALGAAHAAGIVHRDLKPDNIFVSSGPTGEVVKILDFGIAKLLNPGLGAQNRTSTGMIMGTPMYMSPEQAAGDTANISPRSDIYALGIIAYELISGLRPFEAPSLAQLLAKQITEPPIPLAESTQGLPVNVCRAVERALAKDPFQRPQTAGDFCREFSAASTQAPGSTMARVINRNAFAPVSSGVSTGPDSGSGPHPPGPAYSSGPHSPDAGYGSGPHPPSVDYGSGPHPPSVDYGSGPHSHDAGYGSGPHPPSVDYSSGPHAPGVDYGSGPHASEQSISHADALDDSVVLPPKNRAPLIAGLALLGMIVLGVGGFLGFRMLIGRKTSGDAKEAEEKPAKKDIEIYSINVSSKTSGVQIDAIIAGRATIKKTPPFSLEVGPGERIILTAKRDGYKPETETFIAKKNKDIVFDLKKAEIEDREDKEDKEAVTEKSLQDRKSSRKSRKRTKREHETSGESSIGQKAEKRWDDPFKEKTSSKRTEADKMWDNPLSSLKKDSASASKEAAKKPRKKPRKKPKRKNLDDTQLDWGK